MILDIYRDCFSRVYIWSPSINVDSTWRPVKDYIRDHIKPSDRETCYSDSYEPSELEQIIKMQRKAIDYQKEQNHKYLYQIVTLVDDFVDDPSFTRKSQLLRQLYIGGRHYMISTITATQVHKAVSPVIRKNMTHLLIYRLRNYADLQAIIEEMSAVYGPKTSLQTLLQTYYEAIDEPYSFLYISLMTKGRSKMFMKKFDQHLVPS